MNINYTLTILIITRHVNNILLDKIKTATRTITESYLTWNSHTFFRNYSSL